MPYPGGPAGMSKEDPKSPKHLASGPQANRVKVNPQPPNQLCGDVDTLPACENSSLLSMPPVCAGRRKASTEDGEEELSMNPLSREEIFIRTFPGTYWKAGASDEDMSPVRSGAYAQGEEETEDAAGASTDLPLSHSPGGSVSANSLSTSDHFSSPPATQRGDKLRESICRARAEPTGQEMQPDKFEDAPAIPDGVTRKASDLVVRQHTASTDDEAHIHRVATSPASVAQLSQPAQPSGAPQSPAPQPVVQMTQVLAPPKMELSLSGACLDLLVAPGDVLLMRGSGRLAEIGNAGGFMGHVLVVTGKPREVLASSAEAGQLASLWPEKAQAIWRIPTLESTRREQGLWEAESVIMVERLGRQLTLVGEVERDGDVCNFEPHEAVEIWQSPEELRGALRVDLMALVLSDMRKNQASWSATTAARAVLSSAEMVEKPTASQTLEGVKKCWESAPICTSVVINFWQRYLEKLACHSFLQQPDPSLGAGFNPGDKISYWDLSCGTWVSGFVKERVVDGQGDVAVAYHLDIKPSANPQYVRRRLNEETVATKAVDLIRRYVPLKADRALPGDLMRSMQRCYWSCIQQVPLVFRPVMTLPPQPMVINVPVGPSPPTASRPQSPQPQSSSRPRKTSSSHSNPAAPSPTMRPVPVFGHPQSVSPSPGQMPPAAPQNLPVFAFPQNQSRSGGQLPVFAFPGREPGQPGQPPSSPSALPIFAPAGGLAGLGAVPGMALPQQLTPRTPRTPRDEQTSPTAQVAPSPSSPSQPPQEPVQEVQDSEVEWRNLRKGITTSTEGFANEEEGLKEVLSPGDESIDFEEFSDIRNSDGSIGVLMAPGQSRVML
mmetsp:Transcript_134388/g.318571  ORF Transcript_134388/g.318571 Transcript_134388/m.318571 type:complete len:836 (+) Transcript_134388:53-2560(+)